MPQGISEQKLKPPSSPAPLCSYLICMIASEESLLSPMLHIMQLFSLLIVLIERSQSHNVTGRVAAILRRIYRLGKSSARVTCFQGRSAWICRNYPSLHLSPSNAQIRQRGAVAKSDHLCIDLLSQLAAEKWFGFPELQMALTRAAYWPSSLAVMHIKYDMPIDLDEVVNLFEGLHPRMMQLQSLLYETE